ncbi:MAG: restriction endonuclease [Candidatus Taylorbacteria bacterium CG10_big_fil_rev_8_21_14_0_10_41_48]|uniref:Cytosine-specific methyltransferase n=1 Tax=Candidatus Taylorbacteria bacterium CG10_big_fil_rev_8_21_14_0_10_41_48 TaxID=1975024 RepID=A0A2M8LBK8_9BACT|nr:MAG: restriction endonuclease [Candidatus Taylorbacteria bacterium CG10_big_fil_rev_8_21_14_0_10_41_48]
MKNQQNKMTYISLFSSAGVGCYGFSKEGFDCVATVELINRRLDVQRHNNKCLYPSGYIADDITKKTAQEKIFSEIDLWKSKQNLKEIDILLATPPCQGMSVANHKKGDELARNSLVVESIKLVNDIRPRVFIFENVRAFLSTLCTDTDKKQKNIREAIEVNLGGKYNIHYQVINFKDYGNPSSRTRTLVIGVRKDIQEITPLDLMPTLKNGGTLRDAIGDLPSLKIMGEIDKNDIYHNFRPYAEHMLPWIENTKEGQSAFDNIDPKRRPHQIINGKIVGNENKNGDKYSRCYWDKVAPCVHTRNDIFASQATIHPKDNRVFSVRELMRMMSVPDSFNWVGIPLNDLNKLTIEEKRKILKKEEINIRQSLGEAVPTIIFNGIAKNINSKLRKIERNEAQIKKLIEDKRLDIEENLRDFLKENIKDLSYPELAKIVELSNAQRLQHAAYYTRQDICFTIVKDLPDASKFEKLSILEPSVGAGNFLPLLIEKYKTAKEVEIDVIDIDRNAIEILKLLLKKLDIPKNIQINLINADFLLHGETNLFGQSKRYDIVIGNPPFGDISENKVLLNSYKRNKYNSETNNLFSFFLEKAIQQGDIVGLIIPKSFLSAPEFNKTRELVSSFAIEKITDYGEKGFKGVKIETISLIINTRKKGTRTLVESYVKNEIGYKNQSYICSKDFPYWLVYRNEFFDSIAKKLRFNIFTSYRDRQITKKITKNKGKIRILKSRNIGRNEIVDISNYDSYVDSLDGLSISKFWNKENSVLVPNLTYAPRASFLPENTLVDGSVAILTLKENEAKITLKDLDYFGTEEFTEFYRVARNHGTRSLNIDNNSVFFFGVRR